MARDIDRYSRDQRFEIILDSGEDKSRWSDLLGNVENIVSGTEHITGSRSISFDKVAGVSADAYIIRPLDVMNGMGLDAFSSEGQILSSVYLSSITDVSSFNIALLMSSGTDNAVYYSVPATDLSTGWNHLKIDCASYATISGCGVDWGKVKYLAAGVSFDSASDTLSSVLLDGVRIQMPTATFNFDPNIDNVTMQSEVQIKNGNDPDELSVDAANTARTTGTNVIPVQILDSTAKVSPAGETNSNSPFVKLTDGSDDLDLLRADASPTVATILVPTKPVDTQGNVITGGGGTSGGLTLFSTMAGHFTSSWVSATEIDLAGGFPAVNSYTQFVEIEAWDASGVYIGKFTPKSHIFAWDSVNDRVTVTGAAFVTGGELNISILGPDRTQNRPSDAVNTLAVNQYQLNSDDSGVSLITSAQDVTTSWVDLGSEVSTFGYNSLGIWVVIDINDSSDIRLRAVAKHESAGSDEYPLSIETVGSAGNVIRVLQHYWEFDVDSDRKNILTISIDGIVPYVQLQVQARVAGTTPLIPGQIDSIHYTRGWR
ncbi:MAG: hypothetical protein KAS32_21770 [Candidatus Peribacteraceae bacterium]|nr:hypothetical protein [Candidatus Peribacteraceae bacterium]